MRQNLKSIHSVNKILMFSFFTLNVFFVVFILFYVEQLSIHYLLYTNILINILLVSLYLIANNRYLKDFENLMEFFKSYVEDKDIINIPKNTKFTENKKVESLFKKAYIKGNLMKKDYNDLKWVFDKFIPQDIYKKIWFRWYEKIALWNCISKVVTIMFLDIMWFTRISEKFTPERSLLLLNIYFDWIWDLVYRRWWYIDKFLWDWIMIIFEQENTDDALMCGLEIQEFIKKFQVSAIWSKINIWIWINTWEVIMGTIWTKKRMDATVIWDNVNIASRLQTLTRKYNKPIIMSEKTFEMIGDSNKFSLEKLWLEQLTWKDNPVTLYCMDDYYKIDL